MKTWKNPSIEELDLNRTSFEFSGNVADDGFFNGLTQEMGWATENIPNDTDSLS